MSDDVDIQKAVERMRNALEHVSDEDPVHYTELDLQHAIVALGVSPKHLYPDETEYPNYWDDTERFPNEGEIE